MSQDTFIAPVVVLLVMMAMCAAFAGYTIGNRSGSYARRSMAVSYVPSVIGMLIGSGITVALGVNRMPLPRLLAWIGAELGYIGVLVGIAALTSLVTKKIKARSARG